MKGEFVRPASAHRSWITADGSSSDGAQGYTAEAGRYHIYVANNCPWCHRVATTRGVLGLQECITMDVLFYRRDPDRVRCRCKAWVWIASLAWCKPFSRVAPWQHWQPKHYIGPYILQCCVVFHREDLQKQVCRGISG